MVIYQSARTMRRELTIEHQLFAENRAFALRDNFEILESELGRLAMLPQMNAGDENPCRSRSSCGRPQNSVLYNTAVLLLSRDGDCVGAVPDRPEYRNGVRRPAWFTAARGGVPRPSFRVTDEPGRGGR